MTKNFFDLDKDDALAATKVPKSKGKKKSKYRVTCRCGSVPCKRICSVTLPTGERFLEGDYLPDDAPMNDIADLLANHGNAIERED